MKLSDIKTPVSSISGIGPQITKLLAKQNVFTVGDLLQYYPRTYEDRTKKVTLTEFELGKVHTVAQVMGQEWFGYGSMRTLKVIINDGTATAELICFNRSFLERVLVPGTLITVTGQFAVKYGRLQSSSFEAMKMEVPEEFREHIKEFRLDAIQPVDCGVIPVYPLTEGLTQKSLSKAIGKALQQYAHGIEEEIPESIRKERKLIAKQDAVRHIHQPESIAQAQEARRTLAYEELFLFQKVILERAERRKGSLKEAAGTDSLDEGAFQKSLSPLQEKLCASLPFALTADQKKVIFEMNAEIDRSYTERERLLNQLERGMPSPVRPSKNAGFVLRLSAHNKLEGSVRAHGTYGASGAAARGKCGAASGAAGHTDGFSYGKRKGFRTHAAFKGS